MKKLWGLGVSPEATPGGFPHAFGATVGCAGSGLLLARVGRGGNSSFAVFPGDVVVVDVCC